MRLSFILIPSRFSAETLYKITRQRSPGDNFLLADNRGVEPAAFAA
jgi:hypothetical protein